MEKIFQDILNVAGIHGLVLLSREGDVLFESLDYNRFFSINSNMSWGRIVNALEDFCEMDLVYEQGRFYLRETEKGFLLIHMAANVSIAMVKLNCDIIISELKNVKPDKGLKRFFKF